MSGQLLKPVVAMSAAAATLAIGVPLLQPVLLRDPGARPSTAASLGRTNASSGKSADARRQDSKLAEPKHAEVKPPRAAAAAGPPRQATRGWGRVEIPQSRNGHYYADVEINGVRVAMLVDTGAYGVLLNARDAQRVGVVPAPGDFIQRTSTANGVTTVAPTQWREVRVGGISLTNVRGAVARAGAASESLLGMSFLGRLSSFRTESGRLILQE